MGNLIDNPYIEQFNTAEAARDRAVDNVKYRIICRLEREIRRHISDGNRSGELQGLCEAKRIVEEA